MESECERVSVVVCFGVCVCVYFDSLDSLLRFTRCNETNLWKYHRVIWLRSGMKSDENNSISWIQADYADVWLYKNGTEMIFILLSRRRSSLVIVVAGTAAVLLLWLLYIEYISKSVLPITMIHIFLVAVSSSSCSYCHQSAEWRL